MPGLVRAASSRRPGWRAASLPLVSMTSTASAMLRKVVSHHRGRTAQLVMRGDQMLGALGDLRPPAPRWWPGWRSSESCSWRPRAAGRQRQHGRRAPGSARRRRDRSPAGQAPVGLRIRRGARPSSRRSSATSRFEAVPSLVRHRRTVSRWPTSAATAGGVSRGAAPDQLAIERNAWRSTSALVVLRRVALSVGIVLDGVDQCRRAPR